MGNLVCNDHGVLLDRIADRRQLDPELEMVEAETRPVAESCGGPVVPWGIVALVMEDGLPTCLLGSR
jgi:hypothetical protein